MALPALDATVSGTGSNTYATLVEAIAYFEMRPGSAQFVGADNKRIQAALLFAAVLIDREVYYDQKDVSTQALEFPRTGQEDVPTDVKHAQLEQALDILNNTFLEREELLEAQSQGVRQMQTGGTLLRMVPGRPENFAAWRLCPQARELLLPYMETTIRTARA